MGVSSDSASSPRNRTGEADKTPLAAGHAMLSESGLSFLGLGPPPPTPSWDRMLEHSQPIMQLRVLLLLWPSVAISLTVLSLNLLGDGLRDLLKPHLQPEPAGANAALSIAKKIAMASTLWPRCRGGALFGYFGCGNNHYYRGSQTDATLRCAQTAPLWGCSAWGAS